MKNARIFAVGGYLSYRALFNWQSPTFYVPTMLAGPLFQILFFAYLGRFSHVRNDAFFVVGNAVQVSAMAGVFGMSITLAGERWTQTLSAVLATPANRAALFLGRALPNIVNGLIVSTFGFAAGRVLLDFHPAPSVLPALALVVLVTTLSCTAFGLVVGGAGLRLRDAFLVANPTYFLMLLFCGVNIPLASLPGWMQAVGNALPLTHGIEAARAIAGGSSLGSVSGLLWREAAVGAAYACAAYVVFRVLEVESRRRATLDRM
ncbi:MAG: type transport system permease protein [Gaiellaceae bacterium]|jgi:ABC-2 type transport system permease protein|nr:type transport system permease protein [Gaiellaceae bacterium]